jgi:Putative peptidoglycan binding domain
MMATPHARALRYAIVLAPLAVLCLICPVALGSSGHHPHLPRAEVLQVQGLFHVLGYPLGHERAGELGVHTRGAVSYFQHKYGLPVTGYPDPRTIAEMHAVAASLRAAPASAPGPRRDLVSRLLPGVPVLALGLTCALGLVLLALATTRKPAAGRDSL